MTRIQVQLTEDQARALGKLASQRGISMAELIREGAELILAETARRRCRRRAVDMLGRYRDKAADVAVDHDRYLDAAYGVADL